MNFSKKIIQWYNQNKRGLPWRKIYDPYRIWLSEIIMQQTRIDQGLDYYNRFVQQFPDIHHLAQAPENQVLKLWQGLGYYTRARNLHKTARIVSRDYQGIFPDSWKEVNALPGVGPYTASAILSMAFGQRYAVVDGNVFRVLSRLLGDDTPIDSAAGKSRFSQYAIDLMGNSDPGTHNQAVMEFGALYCKPQNPDCTQCIFKDDCVAHKENKVSVLPVKKGKLVQRVRHFYYILFQFRGNDYSKILINKRGDNDIWTNLYDFPLIESDKPLSIKEIQENGYKGISLTNITIKPMGNQYKHILSHQVILASFLRIEIRQKKFAELQKNIQYENLIPINTRDMIRYPVPRLIEKFLEEYPIDGSTDE